MTVNKKHLLKKIFPLLMGGALGYAYYFFIGCNNGCPIQSNPMLSTIYGIFLGAIFILPSKKSK
jgi:hypothetical protein